MKNSFLKIGYHKLHKKSMLPIYNMRLNNSLRFSKLIALFIYFHILNLKVLYM